MAKLFRVEVYIPETDLEAVKSAMFEAGAGKIGDYDCCAWQTPGQGQFRPLQGSNPHLGQPDKIETVKEFKVEMVCLENVLADVLRAMKAAHPYEEVAYAVIALANPT